MIHPLMSSVKRFFKNVLRTATRLKMYAATGKKIFGRPAAFLSVIISTAALLLSSGCLTQLSFLRIFFSHPEIGTHNRLIFLVSFCLSIKNAFPDVHIFITTVLISGLSGINLVLFFHLFSRKYLKIKLFLSNLTIEMLGFVLGIACWYSVLLTIGLTLPPFQHSLIARSSFLLRELLFGSVDLLLLLSVLFRLWKKIPKTPVVHENPPITEIPIRKRKNARNILIAPLSVGIIIAGTLYIGVIQRKELAFSLWDIFRLERLPIILDSKNPELYYLMGNEHFGGAGTYDLNKAKRYFISSIRLEYAFPDAHYQLGRTYFIQGDFAHALFEIRETLRIDPEFKKAYYMYGLINGYQKNYAEAIHGFSEFIKRDDFNWAGYNDLAWIYFQKGDYEKTRDTAKEGLHHAETNPWLQNIYGTALMNLGEKEEAEKAFRIALRETESMSPERWGGAYPGNDPRTYDQGLGQMKAAIRHNLALLED